MHGIIRNCKSGFTLVELSIVLVILGLLVGGVLAGQSLIHAAELRAISNEYDGYRTAINTFREKYSALPGDMPNASRFWGLLDPTPSTCRNISATGTATCDGDGNGCIVVNGAGREVFRAWQHLANAGLIEGQFSGTWNGVSDYTSVNGTNGPRSKYPSGGWSLACRSDADAIGSYYNNVFRVGANYNHWFIFGSDTGGSGLTGNRLLKPEDAYNIDTKLDDGKPGYGRITAYTQWWCTTTAVASTADYFLSNATPVCYLNLGF